jgi:hypothetical protein
MNYLETNGRNALWSPRVVEASDAGGCVQRRKHTDGAAAERVHLYHNRTQYVSLVTASGPCTSSRFHGRCSIAAAAVAGRRPWSSSRQRGALLAATRPQRTAATAQTPRRAAPRDTRPRTRRGSTVPTRPSCPTNLRVAGQERAEPHEIYFQHVRGRTLRPNRSCVARASTRRRASLRRTYQRTSGPAARHSERYTSASGGAIGVNEGYT